MTEEQVMNALKPIEDPELHLGIVELGLIYQVVITPAAEGGTGEDVKLRMTFTSPFCPYGPQLRAQVQKAVTTLPGVRQTQVDIVFTPPWDPRTMASEDCKIALGLGWDGDEEPEAGEDVQNQR